MTTANDTIPPPPPPPEAPRPRLTRSSDDKVLSGLCGGLGRHFGVDPVVFRIAFVVMALAGGTGVLLYLVGWALVPSDRTGASAIEGVGRGRTEQVLAAVVAGVGIVVLLEEVFDGEVGGVTFGMVLFGLGLYLLWSRRPPGPPPGGEGVTGDEGPVGTAPPPPAPEPPPERSPSALVPVTLSLLALLAGGLILLDAAGAVDVSLLVGLSLGLLLVGAALLVGARWGRGRLLIPVGVVLTMALAAVAFVDVPLRGGVGDRTYRHVALAEIDTPYRLAVGELTLDLSGVDLAGTSSRVVASVGVGRLAVVVPAGVAVEIDGEVGAGELRVLERREEGLDVDRRVVEGGREGGGRLVLLARVGMGELEVRRAAA